MRKFLVPLAAAAAVALPSTPGQAIVLLDTDCDLTVGCLFSGNPTDEAGVVAELEAAYNNFHVEPPLPATIDLTGLYKTPGSLAATSGVFSLPDGGLFDFYALKAGEFFILYQIELTDSVAWNTDPQLLNDNGRPQDASHIVAYRSALPPIPEPATWAMMIAGFASIGLTLRRRKQTISFA